MNALTPYLIWIKIAAALALVGALVGYHHHVFEQGVAQESARRDKIDAGNTIAAQAELATLNARVRTAQAELAVARDQNSKLLTENDHEKATSAGLQLDLAAGTQRMSILTRQRAADRAGPATGSTAGPADQGAGVIEDIAPAVAAGLERLRSEHNEAIDRLEACIFSYDTVKAAADAIQKAQPNQ